MFPSHDPEGKTLTISGLMRTPRSKVIGAGAESAVMFDDLVIFAPSDLALEVIGASVRNMNGRLYIREAINGGVLLAPTTTPSNVEIYVDGFGGNPAFDFSSGVYSYSDYFLTAVGPKDNSNYLDASGALNCNIRLNIDPAGTATTSAININGSRASFQLSRSIIENDIAVSFDGAQSDIWIYGRGLSDAELSGYSTPVVGMKAPLGVGGTLAGMAVYTGVGASGWQVPSFTDL